MVPRFHVVVSGPSDLDNLRLALEEGMKLADAQLLDLTIFVPSIGQLRGSDLERLLGKKNLKAIRDGDLKAANGGPVSLVSVANLVPRRERGVVIGLWCGVDMVGLLEECTYAKDVVVLTQTTTEIADWISDKKPNVLKI